MTQRFFPDGKVTAAAFDAAETAARVEIEAIASEFGPSHWRDAYASSGTAAALAEILEQNGFSSGGITPAGLARLRKRLMLARQHPARLHAQRAQARARAGSRRRSRDHDRRRSPSCASSASIRSAARCGSASSTTCSAARSTRTSAQLTVERFRRPLPHRPGARGARRGAGHVALFARIARNARPEQTPAAAMGCAAARNRHVGLAHRVSQARRVHPAARRHAGFLGRRADRAWPCSSMAAAAAWPRCEPALSDPMLRAQIAGVAPGGAVLITRAPTIALPRSGAQDRPAASHFGVTQRWLAAAPADRASARRRSARNGSTLGSRVAK